jgi:hypothetical protein
LAIRAHLYKMHDCLKKERCPVRVSQGESGVVDIFGIRGRHTAAQTGEFAWRQPKSRGQAAHRCCRDWRRWPASGNIYSKE